jgi:RNA polymerase sigma-70 factor (ECF subfamily)
MDDRRRRFEVQVLPHLDSAYRFARWLTRSPEDAEDVAQEAILRAYRGFDALRGSDVKAWLLTIVRNCHATSFKKQRQLSLVPLPEEHDADGNAVIATDLEPEGASILRDEERNLEKLMAGLSDEHREILVLREIEDMDYRAIAAVTKLPLGTVMSRLARARLALKRHWLRHTEGQPRAVP